MKTQMKMENDLSKKYLTRKQTAKLLHVEPTTVDTYIKKGILNAQKIGRRVLIKHKDIEQSLNKKQ